jgi:sulfur relay (sulfurtransferase) DsrC/TusE family protein
MGLAFVIAAEPPQKPATDRVRDKPAVSYRLSGPYTHDNLTIFLIHGDDQIKGKDILTLDEALKQKKVVVHETKNVNQLAIENVSTDEVFVQAGDIVRGGQQDRTIAFDMIVPPKSGKVPLGAFCVESGRWTQRGKEGHLSFSASTNQLASNGLKLAARKGASQKDVWDKVSKAQMDLKKSVKDEVQAGESKSSLELTLEHKKVVEAVRAYQLKLQFSPQCKKDVIGYAVVINGKVNNADVYASNALFHKLWPKLLKASAVEAVAEKNDKKFESAKVDAVKAFLADAEKGKKSEKKINERFRQVEQENAKSILFETSDRDKKDVSLRRSYIAK